MKRTYLIILLICSLIAVSALSAVVLMTPKEEEHINPVPSHDPYVIPDIVSEEKEENEQIDEREEPVSFEDIVRIEPPKEVHAVYLTFWSATSSSKIQYILDLIDQTEINAVVIDIKDFSGFVAYPADVEEVRAYGSGTYYIQDLRGLLSLFRERGVYTIARITVFQDSVLARARPDLAVHSVSRMSPSQEDAGDEEQMISTDTLWADRKGLHWIDPASEDAWKYHADIARDAFEHGFDEINFDYIRFPSDGELQDMYFPVWDEEEERRYVLRAFFEYLSDELPGIPLSADVFGLVTTSSDDLGIGQVLEDTFGTFDFVSPMVYPSHYWEGTYGFAQPVAHPYEIVFRSLDRAQERLELFSSATDADEDMTSARETKIRPWLQDFTIGGVPYGVDEVQDQIRASRDALGEGYAGYMLWSPRNIYTLEALKERDENEEEEQEEAL